MKITKHKNGTVSILNADLDVIRDLALGMTYLATEYHKQTTTGRDGFGQAHDEFARNYTREQAARADFMERVLRDSSLNAWSRGQYLPDGASIEISNDPHDRRLFAVTKDGRRECNPD